MTRLLAALRSLYSPSARKRRARCNQPCPSLVAGEELEQRTMFDADDQLSEAFNLGAMTANRSRTGQSIDVATDVDMYRFTVAAGQRIAFDIDRPSGRLDSYLRLFDAAGNELAFNDDGPAPGEAPSTESYLEYTFQTAGTYFIGVSGFGNQSYNPLTGAGDRNGSTGAYSLFLTRVAVAVTTPAPSDTDPDDQISEAIFLGAMTQARSRTGEAISISTDVDMFSFSVSAGQRIAFDIDRPSGNLDSYLRLFDAAGNQLALNDDGPHPSEGNSLESYLEFTFNTAGVYYVGVSGFGNHTYNPLTGAGDSNGSTGAYSLHLTVVNAAPPPAPSGSGFQITLAMSGLTVSQQNVFRQAAARWSQIIVGDLPDVLFNGQLIDDVLIVASAVAIDGVGGILGQAGPTNLRAGTFLPFRGIMQFDSADMANMEANGTLLDVVLHEMGHVLGVGTIWANLGRISGAGTADPRFTGPQATAAYNQIFGRNESGVPVANVGGSGSRDSHWRESVFGNEIMSPVISGTPNPISRVTVASLADLGYVVNMNAADHFTPPGSTGSGATGGTNGGSGVFAEHDHDHDHEHDHDEEHDHEHIALPAPVVSGIVLPALSRRQAATLEILASANQRAAAAYAAHLAAVDQLMACLHANLALR